jgi:starch phosphorylase
MGVSFEEKHYGFLTDTEIKFKIRINKHDVYVKAWYCHPDLFSNAPLFLLSTDLPENDYLARTISHKLYDSNPETAIAAAILLGEGGAKLLEELKWEPDVYHLNESHALPLAFYLFKRYGKIEDVKKKLVFTNHTPEAAGNQKSNISFLEKMGFFNDMSSDEIALICGPDCYELDHTDCALKMSGKSNGVSALHLQTLKRIWANKNYQNDIISITNGQHFGYWHEKEFYKALNEDDDFLEKVKKKKKKYLFEIVADQCGELFSENILTLVFAKRFTGYKRADIFFHDMDRFERLISQKEYPVQIIWAGKPYPMDFYGIGVFDKIVDICKSHKNCAILTGYELSLSHAMKAGSDIWINMPRMGHEASGTSGISAAMNASINVAIPDGWFPEFSNDKINSFVVHPSDPMLPEYKQDDLDCISLYDVLESSVIPIYYNEKEKWYDIIRRSMNDIFPKFGSERMVVEYYEKMYDILSP